MNNNAEIIQEEEYPLFQEEGGGAVPTSPLQVKLKQVNKLTAQKSYNKWHYLGGHGFLSTYNFGVYFDDRCEGCISYGIPNARNIEGVYTEDTQFNFMELTRLALSDKCPKYSESRVIAISLKMLKKLEPKLRGIITYADTEQGHTGIIYRASNFDYKGLTAQKTDLFVNGRKFGKQKGIKYSEIDGEWRKRSRKHLFIKYFK